MAHKKRKKGIQSKPGQRKIGKCTQLQREKKVTIKIGKTMRGQGTKEDIAREKSYRNELNKKGCKSIVLVKLERYDDNKGF